MVIYGWDASDFDWSRGPMDLGAARAAGVDFFTHKATEGTSTQHAHYGEALRRARDAGVPFLGAYHVVRSGPTIAAQVDYLLAYADAATPWWRQHPGWFWQCDLERWSYDSVAPGRGADFCAALAAKTGRAVLLYAPQWAYGDTIGGTAPLWASSYVVGSGDFRQLYPGDGSSRWQAYSGRTPVILQYTSSATIGRQPGCDANAFRGSVADFKRLIGGDDMANLGYADNDGQFLCERERALLYLDKGTMGPEKGVTFPLVELLKRLDAAATEDKARDDALAAAVKTLAVGAGIDPDALFARVDAAVAAAVKPLQDQLAAVQAQNLKLARALAAAGGALDAADD